MKATSDFEQFYLSVLQPEMDSLEDYRKEVKQQYDTYLFLAFLGLLLYYFITTGGTLAGLIPMLFFYGIPATYLLQWNSKRIRDKFSYRFKSEIMGRIVAFNNPALQHNPEKGIMLKAVEISKIFNDSLQKFDSNDLIEGKMGKTTIQFSNVKLVHKTWGMKSKFSGLFLIALFNKRFAGEYYVISNRSNSASGSSITKSMQQTNASRPKLIKTESPLFEREFSVFGSDPIEAMYILTPALMQRMLDFKEKVKGEVHFSFNRSRMFAAIEGKNNIFYPPLRQQVSKDDLEEWNHNLGFALDLVNDIQLNTRIWTVK